MPLYIIYLLININTDILLYPANTDKSLSHAC